MNFFSNLSKFLATSLFNSVLYIIRIPVFVVIIKHLFRLFNPRKDVLMTLHGLKIYVNTIDRIMAVLFWKFSNAEKQEHDFITDYVREGMCVVDVGANVGYHTLQLAQSVGKKGRVYAFEPDPNNYRLLLKNIKANQYHNIIAVQKAVSNKPGVVLLFMCEENRGDHRIFNSNDGRKSVDVEAVTLDLFFENIGKNIDLIKIDTQGAECLVFSGMSKLVKKSDRLTVICEFVPSLLTKCGFSGEELLAQIRDLGFHAYSIDENNSRLNPVEDKQIICQYAKEGKYTNLLLKKG